MINCTTELIGVETPKKEDVQVISNATETIFV